MFGGQSAFGSTGTGFGATPAFGAAPQTSVFGGTQSTFGAQQNKPAFGGTTFGGGGGGLFGSNPSSSGGLFGGTSTTTSTFGGGGGAFGQPSTTFGAGGFGQTTQQQSGGGLFGSTTTSQSGGLFSQPAATGFGSTAGTSGFGSGGSSFGFGGAQQQQAGTAHVKFNPMTGSDTMMKSGVQTSISTRHQCIVCMKEYESKSMEELRCEDYLAGRRGTAGTAPSGGGLFGSTQPATGGGLFGSQPASSSGGMFGQQQKPLFGTSGGFGATTTSAAPAFGTGGFGQQTTQSGGLFGAKPFGQTTTSTTGFGGFGQTQTQQQSGGLFGQQNKPFGSVAPQPSGGLFGASSTSGGFGATGTTTFGGFGTQNQQQQPQQNIGLFGQQNQAKPAFGGFGAQPASSAPAFGGFGTSTTTQSGGLFGATNQQKPAFGGFGATTSQPSTGFGGFGAASSSGGGLFGSSQAKPAFSFGGTSTASTGFGGFGASTSGTTGGLFSNQNKPGGLFGGTSTTGFGTGTSGFGTGSAFGAGSTGFGTTGGFGQMGAAQAPAGAAASGPTIQQQLLMSLASSPFGDNPLFKPVAETGKRSEVLKPGATPAGPSAQKVLSAGQYKVSPHRNIKVRAKAVDSSKSSMFEGLEDDLPSSSDMFVPRSSVKKLVLRSKKTQETNSTSLLTTLGDDPSQETSLTVPLDESRISVKKLDIPRAENDATSPVDDSFVALNTRKKVSEEKEDDNGQEKSGLNNSRDSNDTDKDDDGSSHPGGVILKRSGYYTIPPLQDIIPDNDGNCIVEGFTIGREGYGNIHYPGNTNITGLNLDEIVFFRHKEVIVYPDDGNKPPLGEGLNKAAQITLDKVWPTDKSDSSIIKSPDRLRGMSYEEKLIRASSRLGARFIEYRPETGSWVFRVDHFSKYGLDESDEEDVVDNNKKVKTMHLEKRRTTLDQPSPSLENRNLIVNGEPLDNAPIAEVTESDGAPDSDGADVEMNDMSSAILQQKTFLRSALFSEGLDEGEMAECPPAKPIILQHRNKSPGYLEARPRLTEEKMNSMVIPTSKGLGGSFLLGDSNTSLLRSHYSTQSMSMNVSTTLNQSRNQSATFTNLNRSKPNRMPSYTLTSGYDKFTQLQSSVVQEHPDPVTPQFVETELPLERSYLSKRFKQYADAGLFQNKRFRVGFLNCWDHVENPGGGYVNLCQVRNNELLPWELQSLESWLQVALDTSDCSTDVNGPQFTPIENLDTLHAHFLEAVRQIQECQDDDVRDKLWEIKHTWDLLVSLWGKMGDDGEEMEEGRGPVEPHTETIERRGKFSAWLEKGVEVASRRDVLRARERTDYLGKVRGLLTGGQLEDACDAIQSAGDHRSALLLAQLGGGGTTSKLLNQQLDQWTEVKADKFISPERIQLLSLVAGQPVHQGTTEAVNTCSKLDWQRSMAQHLWYLTHPVASISDTLEAYDAAWQGNQSYSARPHPRYLEDEEGNMDENGNQEPLDIKYHLIKLYADRSHRLESTLAPTTHTSDQLDFRTSWLIFRVISSLGYKMAGSSNSDRLCLDFASQLEHLGLWDWAVFVLLNIKQSELRRSSVMSVLGRQASLEDGGKEDWVINTLGVPTTWVARARAVLARKEGRFTQLTEQLLLAEDWNEAHKVIISEIAPSAVLSLNYDQLESFLRQIADPTISQQICGWESEGKVYLQFIDVDTAVNRFLQNRDIDTLGYELERLKPLVTNLCRTICNLPVKNSKQRLAQSEIAKKVAHFMRAVYSFESGASGCAATTARQLAESLSTLPLPEDYALQELRTLTRSYLAEIMDS